MSFIILKDKIISKLKSISEIQQVEEYPTEDFNGFPAVMIRSVGNTSDYWSTTDNDEIYTFMLTLFQINDGVQDIKKSRRIIEELCDTIRDNFDSDEFLNGTVFSSNRVMIGVKPTTSKITEADNGKYTVADIELAIRIAKTN
jgi:5-carboxymethyl-2-hydroxymuconate isomerase